MTDQFPLPNIAVWKNLSRRLSTTDNLNANASDYFQGPCQTERLFGREKVCAVARLFKILGRVAVTPRVQGQVRKLLMLFLIFYSGDTVPAIHAEVNSAQ